MLTLRSRSEVTEDMLVSLMQAGDERAFTEFVRRWQPLLSDAARRLGLPPDDGDDLVADVLAECASAFGSGREAPRAMASYLVTAMRNRARNHWRNEERRRARELAAHEGMDGAAPAGTLADASGSNHPRGAADSHAAGNVSGDTRRSWAERARMVREPSVAAASDAESPRAAPPLLRLAYALMRELPREDRLLLVWSGHRVPHRTIAEWLGSSPAAVTKRIERLRARLRSAAVAHLEKVPEAERMAVLRVIRRAEPAWAELPRAQGTRGARSAKGEDQRHV